MSLKNTDKCVGTTKNVVLIGGDGLLRWLMMIVANRCPTATKTGLYGPCLLILKMSTPLAFFRVMYEGGAKIKFSGQMLALASL